MSDSDLTLRQLRALLHVAETRNFRRAAERMGVTQPSLSAQIQNLEAVMGLLLVERGRAGATLTPTGREVASRARRLVDGAEEILDFARAAQGGVGSLKLGVTPSIGPYLLPAVVAELRRSHPDLRLTIHEATPPELSRELGEGALDAILTQLPVGSKEFLVQDLFLEPLLLVMARDHPLAGKASIRPADLADLEVLTLDARYILHGQVADLCEAFGAKIVEGYNGSSLDALRLMAGLGAGVTFLPALYVRSEIRFESEVIARRIEGRALNRRVGLVWRKSMGSPAALSRLSKVISDVVGALAPNLVGGGSP